MKIYNGTDIKEIERLTVSEQKLTWSQLMTKASTKFVQNISTLNVVKHASEFVIICGSGNNGGDGLEIAKIINQITTKCVSLWIPDFFPKRSTLNQKHLKFLTHRNNINIYSIDHELLIPTCSNDSIIIDAFFGIGLDRPLNIISKVFIEKINDLKNYMISVDIPSGLYSDKLNSPSDIVMSSDYIVSFQYPKSSFFFEENLEMLSNCSIENIGLTDSSYEKPSFGEYLNSEHTFLKLTKRKIGSYKSENGKAVIIGGSKGMAGAPILASLAIQLVGAGYSTIQSCSEVLHSIKDHPEILKLETNIGNHIKNIILLEGTKIGIGPGLGVHKETANALQSFLSKATQPLVIDADALNIISSHQLIHLIPSKSILTPHIGEFKKLIGKNWKNGFDKLSLLREFTIENKCIVVLKGPHTCISDEHGKLYFNSSGNQSLAVAGSGDILTGMITGFLAQGYSPLESAAKGVYFHGRASDLYIKDHHMLSLTPLSLLNYIDAALYKTQDTI